MYCLLNRSSKPDLDRLVAQIKASAIQENKIFKGYGYMYKYIIICVSGCRGMPKECWFAKDMLY